MMNTIVNENQISFKELEQKFLNMYASLPEKLHQRCSKHMIMNLQKAGIKSCTAARESDRPALKPYMVRWSIQEMYTAQKQKMVKPHMYFCLIRQCRWIK